MWSFIAPSPCLLPPEGTIILTLVSSFSQFPFYIVLYHSDIYVIQRQKQYMYVLKLYRKESNCSLLGIFHLTLHWLRFVHVVCHSSSILTLEDSHCSCPHGSFVRFLLLSWCSCEHSCVSPVLRKQKCILVYEGGIATLYGV